MKVTVQVGDVGIKYDGPALSLRAVRTILADCAKVAGTLVPAAEPEPERAPMGFAAPVLERLPDELPPEPEQ